MAERQHRTDCKNRWRGLCLIVLFFSAVSAFADDPAALIPQVKSLGFSDTEIQSLEDVVLAAYQAIVAARADVTSDRAVLTRQLLLPNVTMKDLEPTVRHSIEAELKIRMAELDRQLKIRHLIGDKRWARLMEMVGTLKKQNAPTDGNSDDSSINRILHVLRVLGS